jgi:hypothetical protein
MKVFLGVLRGGDCIGDARSAWRLAGVLVCWMDGGLGHGLGCSGAGQDGTSDKVTQGHLPDCFICILSFQIFPGISLAVRKLREAIQGSIDNTQLLTRQTPLSFSATRVHLDAIII